MTGTEAAVLEIDLAAVVANWHDLAARHQSGPVAGVVKADAYGLGARQIALALYEAGCRHFFVAHLAEALAIRPVIPGAMLAVLNGVIAGTEPDYIAHDITPVLGSLPAIAGWRVAHGGKAILHVDTGMNRLGLDAADLAALATDPTKLRGLDIRYIMTHLVASEIPADPENRRQHARFAAARALLPPARSSFANSSGIFLGPDFASDLARPGAALYGINPTPGRPNPMRNVVTLRARILQIRDIPQGATVGYNGTWTAPRPSRIATLAVGYADGWPRGISNRGHAFFDGRPVPLVGRVSMDLTTYDVTDFPAIQAGAWLELMGPSLPPDAVADAAGTNGYEILTSLGARYARVYRA